MKSRALLHDEAPDVDQRVCLRIGWKGLEALLAAKGDDPLPRITYLDGVLELKSPAKLHESISRGINLLLFVWAEEQGVDLEPTGSWTLKNRLKAAGAEPDECWVVGDRPNATRPDLALEVVHTHGDLDKLEVYRRLGIREVWFWMKGALSVHVLHPGGYVRAARSALFPKLDLKQLALFVRHPSRARAPRLYRAALRRKAPRPNQSLAGAQLGECDTTAMSPMSVTDARTGAWARRDDRGGCRDRVSPRRAL